MWGYEFGKIVCRLWKVRKIVKVCLHSCKAVQTFLQFHEFFPEFWHLRFSMKNRQIEVRSTVHCISKLYCRCTYTIFFASSWHFEICISKTVFGKSINESYFGTFQNTRCLSCLFTDHRLPVFLQYLHFSSKTTKVTAEILQCECIEVINML